MPIIELSVPRFQDPAALRLRAWALLVRVAVGLGLTVTIAGPPASGKSLLLSNTGLSVLTPEIYRAALGVPLPAPFAIDEAHRLTPTDRAALQSSLRPYAVASQRAADLSDLPRRPWALALTLKK